MLEKRVIFPFSSIDYILIVYYIFLMNITYVFAIITCLGFLVSLSYKKQPWPSEYPIEFPCYRTWVSLPGGYVNFLGSFSLYNHGSFVVEHLLPVGERIV